MTTTLTYPTAGRYDTRYLLDQTVTVPGFDIEFSGMGELPWPLFHDMVTKISYDIAEQAFSHYLIALDNGKPLTAIPAFPSRFFPQLGITVNVASGIERPADLVGKRVGVLGFGYNPAAWLRGILERHHGVPVREVVWVEDADDPFLKGLDYGRGDGFRVETLPGLSNQLFDGPKMQPVPALENGEIDALISPGGGAPTTERTRRLFQDGDREIESFVRATGIFPINTLITLKKSVVDAHPELPAELLAAFRAAREHYHRELVKEGPGDHMGIGSGLLESLGLFPDHYSVTENRRSIDAIIDYCHDHGVISRRFSVEEIFALPG